MVLTCGNRRKSLTFYISWWYLYSNVSIEKWPPSTGFMPYPVRYDFQWLLDSGVIIYRYRIFPTSDWNNVSQRIRNKHVFDWIRALISSIICWASCTLRYWTYSKSDWQSPEQPAVTDPALTRACWATRSPDRLSLPVIMRLLPFCKRGIGRMEVKLMISGETAVLYGSRKHHYKPLQVTMSHSTLSVILWVPAYPRTCVLMHLHKFNQKTLFMSGNILLLRNFGHILC